MHLPGTPLYFDKDPFDLGGCPRVHKYFFTSLYPAIRMGSPFNSPQCCSSAIGQFPCVPRPQGCLRSLVSTAQSAELLLWQTPMKISQGRQLPAPQWEGEPQRAGRDLQCTASCRSEQSRVGLSHLAWRQRVLHWEAGRGPGAGSGTEGQVRAWGRGSDQPAVPTWAVSRVCRRARAHPTAAPRLPAPGHPFLAQGVPGSSSSKPAAWGAPSSAPCLVFPVSWAPIGEWPECAAQVCGRVRVHPLPSAEGAPAAHTAESGAVLGARGGLRTGSLVRSNGISHRVLFSGSSLLTLALWSCPPAEGFPTAPGIPFPYLPLFRTKLGLSISPFLLSA